MKLGLSPLPPAPGPAVAILRFAQDKRRAIAGQRRIPESTLLGWALLGGTPGAFAARHRVRHKTRKQPFVQRLEWIAMVQAGVATGLAVALLW